MHKSAPFWATCLLGLSLTGVSGCASLSGTPEPANEDSATPANGGTEATAPAEITYADFDPNVLYLLLSAEIAAQRGRFDVTLVNYVKAAKQSRDLGVIERAMRFAQSLNGDNAQQQLAELWLDVDPNAIQAHRVAAIQAVKRNDFNAVLRHMEAIMNQGEDADFDSLAAMAANLPQAQQQELLTLYQQLAARHPDTPELEYSIALLQKINGQPEPALARLDTLLAEYPNFQPAILLKGDLLYELDQQREALNYLMINTRRFPANRQLGTLYGRMLLNAGELQAAQDEFQRLVERFPGTPGLRLSHALVALENGQPDLAREELIHLTNQGHHTNEANYYLGRLEDDAGNADQAIHYYQSVEQGNYYFPALARASALLADQGRLQEALEDIRYLREAHPKRAENYWLLEINLLLDEEQESQALDTAARALEQFPDNIEVRYARAMLHDSLGNYDEAEADLRQIIDTDPGNAVALNALGYILTIRTDRLEEARGYIERALALDPDNPAILDSMGWVLFRAGQIRPALNYLRQAWDAYPDPEVAAHYGEALWAIGEQEQARIIWQEGLDQDPDHEILRETIQRLDNDGAQ